MFLRDFYCTACDRVRADVVVDAGVVQLDIECDDCRELTCHRAVCNGGTGYRYRDCDLPDDPRWYRGQVEVSPVEATAGGEKVMGLDGKPMQSRFDGDARAMRRDRQYWEADRKRGLTPMHFDQRKA